MGFNPITGGGGTTSAHTHTNLASDGGSLDSNTLINNAKLYTLLVAGL